MAVTNQRYKSILRHVPQDASVLDVGATRYDMKDEDEDWLHKHLTDHAATVVGIDIHEQGVESAQKEGYEMYLADAQNFELEQSFDVVVAAELIEHLDCPGQFLESVDAHLNTDGQLILSTPVPWLFHNVKQIFGSSVGDNPASVPNDHVAWYCPQTINNLLGRYGFELSKTEFIPAKELGISRLLYSLGFQRVGAQNYVFIGEREQIIS